MTTSVPARPGPPRRRPVNSMRPCGVARRGRTLSVTPARTLKSAVAVAEGAPSSWNDRLPESSGGIGRHLAEGSRGRARPGRGRGKVEYRVRDRSAALVHESTDDHSRPPVRHGTRPVMDAARLEPCVYA